MATLILSHYRPNATTFAAVYPHKPTVDVIFNKFSSKAKQKFGCSVKKHT